AGLVERQQNPADRRARRVVATPAGRRRLGAWAGAVHDAEEEMLGMLAPDERALFRTLMRRVACGVRDVDAGTDPCTVAEHTLGSTPTPSWARRRSAPEASRRRTARLPGRTMREASRRRRGRWWCRAPRVPARVADTQGESTAGGAGGGAASWRAWREP